MPGLSVVSAHIPENVVDAMLVKQEQIAAENLAARKVVHKLINAARNAVGAVPLPPVEPPPRLNVPTPPAKLPPVVAPVAAKPRVVAPWRAQPQQRSEQTEQEAAGLTPMCPMTWSSNRALAPLEESHQEPPTKRKCRAGAGGEQMEDGQGDIP